MSKYLRKYTDKNYSEIFYPIDYLSRPLWDLEAYLCNLSKYVERKEDDLSRALDTKSQDYLTGLITKTTNRALCLALLIEMKKEGLADQQILRSYEERRLTGNVGYVTLSDVSSGETSNSAQPTSFSDATKSLKKTGESSSTTSRHIISTPPGKMPEAACTTTCDESDKKALLYQSIANSIKGNAPMPYPQPRKSIAMMQSQAKNFDSFETYDQPPLAKGEPPFSFNEDSKDV